MRNTIFLLFLLLPISSSAQKNAIAIISGITTNDGPHIYKSKSSRAVNLYFQGRKYTRLSVDWTEGLQFLHSIKKWQFGVEISVGEITTIATERLIDTTSNRFVYADYKINIAKPYLSSLALINWKINLSAAYIYIGLAAGALYHEGGNKDSVVHYYPNDRKYYDRSYPGGLGFTWRFQLGTEIKLNKNIGINSEYSIGSLYLGKDQYNSAYNTSLNRIVVGIRYYL